MGTIKASIVISAASLLIGASANADSNNQSPEATTGSSTNNTDNSTSIAAAPSSSGAQKSKRNGFGKKLASITAGLAVGSVANAVRKPIDEEKLCIDDLGGKKPHNGRFTVPFAIFWAPFAFIQGFSEAPFYALDRALTQSDKPFSKEQMSLKEPPLPSAEDRREYHGATERTLSNP